jgi:hypothetical protein
MKKRGKRGQEVLGMSFGMIFSILLIVFFIVIAFIVINSFLKTQKCAQTGVFITDFKDEIKKAFNSPSEDSDFTRNLPSSIEYVCFSNALKPITASGSEEKIGEDIGIYSGKDANLFFYPRTNSCGASYFKIDNLNIEKTAGADNLKCFEVKDGKIKIHVQKGINENLVSLS